MTKTRLTFMGSGTSQGVPVIGCNCPVCKSTDPKDKRFRSSVLVEHEGMTILVDAGPDFRSQMLREGITHLDAILLTHNHKDHTGGLDDVRALNYTEGRACDIYCEKYVEDSLRQEYAYAFSEHKYPGVPEWHIHNIENQPFEVIVDDNAPRLQWVSNEGYKEIVCGGFSAGCDMLLRAIIFTPVRCDILILQSPWIPILQDRAEDLVNAEKRKNIELKIFCGSDDEDCLPLAKQLYEITKKESIHVEFTIQKGNRHQFPKEAFELKELL